MKLALAYPSVPPETSSIGEHTVRLAAAVTGVDVSILTATRAPRPVEGVRISSHLVRDPSTGTVRLPADRTVDADWLVVQWNPNSWGRRGWCPGVVRHLARLGDATGRPRLATVVHEVGQLPIGWRRRLMNTWQYALLARVLVASDVVFVAAESMVGALERITRATPTIPLPVGSNVDVVTPRPSPASVRARLGLSPDAFVIGLFGRSHPSRDQAAVAAAAHAVARSGRRVEVLALGAGRSDGLDVHLPVRLVATGYLPGPEVSEAFAAVDVFASPFTRGVSTRRASFVAALAHALPTVTTIGAETGERLRRECGGGFVAADCRDVAGFAAHVERLAANESERTALSERARRLHGDLFAWPDIARRLVDALSEVDADVDAGPIGAVRDGARRWALS